MTPFYQKKAPLLSALVLSGLPFAGHAAPHELTSSYLNQSGAELGQTHRAANLPDGLLGPQDTFWRRGTLTGDWNDQRNQLLYDGLSLSPSYHGEVFGNTGGVSQGQIADGLLNLGIDADLERVTDFWKDAILHANLVYIYGSSLSAQHIGDFSNTSNLSGYNSIRLQELWLEQSFWIKRASVRIGMLAADTEFFTSDSAGLFLNGTFGAFTLIGANFTNAPIYPVASPGIRFFVHPVPKFYFRCAAFGMDSNADPAGNNNHGTHFNINKSDGVLWMAEAGYLVNQAPNDRGLIGTYKVGTFVQRGNYSTWKSQADNALGTGSLSGKGTNQAVYGVGDQEVYKSGGRIITLFTRGGVAPSSLSFVDGYVDAGFNLSGFVPGRPQDTAGVAIARSSISSQFSESAQLQGNPKSTAETVLEATYKVKVAPWWTLQPDVQYIVNPSGASGSRNAFVMGVRTNVIF